MLVLQVAISERATLLAGAASAIFGLIAGSATDGLGLDFGVCRPGRCCRIHCTVRGAALWANQNQWAIYPIIVVVLVGALVALEFGLWAIGHLYGYDGTCTPLLTPTLEPSRWTCDWEEFAEIQLKGAMMASAPALWINAIIVPIVFVATVGRRRVGP